MCPAEECGVGVRKADASLCSACPAEECGVGVQEADSDVVGSCSFS